MYRYLTRLHVIVILALLTIPVIAQDTSSVTAGEGQPLVTLALFSPNSVQSGDTFGVNVALDMEPNSHAISALTLVLNFDPTVLQATAFSPNTSAFPQLQLLEQLPFGPGIGTIGLTVATGSDPTNAIQSSEMDTIAFITFQAVGPNGSSTTLNWERTEALSVSAWDEASENVVGTANSTSICIAPCNQPTYSISGRITDANGNPIDNATIFASYDDEDYDTSTTADGSYQLSSLPSATYRVRPSKNGYTFSPDYRTVTVPPDTTSQDFVATPVDTTPPTVSWVSPVTSEGQVYSSASGVVSLEVSVTDDSSGIAQVRFSRWDAVNEVVVELGAVYSAPYRTSVDVNTLNLGWNEIDADISDNAGNSARTYFWIERIPPPPLNLVDNPGFENDFSTDKWTNNNKFTRSIAQKNSDSYSGRFYATDNSGVTISQTMTTGLIAGKTYTSGCSTNIPTQRDTTFTFKLQVQWRNASNSTLRTDTITTYKAKTSGWNRVNPSLIAPAGTTNSIFKLVVSSLNGEIFVDDCVLQPQ